ncbi:glycerol-3-phosphate dehydrogenase [Pseudomonas sp. BAY1663]|nr:glycerol-3-phosphate dehydrogenase [Pseudomonas sp. BAY1663]
MDYLIVEEWALSLDDILWRRSKLGLFMQPDECERLQRYLDGRSADRLTTFERVAQG